MTTLTVLDTGVKRQEIISIAEVPESYKNIKALLDLINTNNVRFIISCDLKVANLVCGIQSHSREKPCCWCDIVSEIISTKEISRTFGSLKKNHKFVAAGPKINKTKEFRNVAEASLVIAEDIEIILGSIAPTEIHLLIFF